MFKRLPLLLVKCFSFPDELKLSYSITYLKLHLKIENALIIYEFFVKFQLFNHFRFHSKKISSRFQAPPGEPSLHELGHPLNKNSTSAVWA